LIIKTVTRELITSIFSLFCVCICVSFQFTLLGFFGFEFISTHAVYTSLPNTRSDIIDIWGVGLL